MRRFIIEKSEDEFYSSHSGLALVGLCLNRFTSLAKRLGLVSTLKKGAISHADVVRSYIGLLCLGKSDFETISGFRPLATGHVPLDIDVFTQDNSGTKKQGVSRTYQSFDGFAPIAAYLALEGWLLEIAHREGSQHSQKNFIPFLARVLHKALALTAAPLLVRLDSAHDAWETRIELCGHERVDYILKWNPRGHSKTLWHRRAFAEGKSNEPRPGICIALLSVRDTHAWTDETGAKRELTCRRVVRVTERTIDKKGQLLLEPEIELEGGWTSLTLLGGGTRKTGRVRTDSGCNSFPGTNY